MKKTTLIKFFTFYTIKVILVPIMISIIVVALFLISMQLGVLKPANYEQKLVEKSIKTIENSNSINHNMVPEPLEYIIIDKHSKKLIKNGNMNSNMRNEALEYVANSKWPSGLDNPRFVMVEGKNQTCVIKYSVIVKFSNKTLRDIVPYPGITIVLICVVLFIIILIILSKKTSNRVKVELQKILKTTEKIKDQDLDFTSEVNAIKEFNLVSESLDSLRDALKTSLKEQIDIEKNKMEQIGALAHDIKIPITIIKGNSELLSIKNENKEESEFIDDIISASDQIELYTQSLVEVSKMSSKVELQKHPVLLSDFFKKIQREAEILGKMKQCKIVFNSSLSNETTIIDFNLIYRALINIVANGIEHMEELTEMQIKVYSEDIKELVIEVQDSGKGFSEEALEKATLIFFTEDKAREGKHNGIGLNFAKKVIEAHGGTLSLENTNIGGLVRIILPIETNH